MKTPKRRRRCCRMCSIKLLDRLYSTFSRCERARNRYQIAWGRYQIAWDRHQRTAIEYYSSPLRGHPPDGQADAPPAKEDAPKPEPITITKEQFDPSCEALSPQAPASAGTQPLAIKELPQPEQEVEPSIVIFGHLYRASSVFVCQTVRDAKALWRALPERDECAVVALPDPQDIRGLIIKEQQLYGHN